MNPVLQRKTNVQGIHRTQTPVCLLADSISMPPLSSDSMLF